jgi:hypothetical protein
MGKVCVYFLIFILVIYRVSKACVNLLVILYSFIVIHMILTNLILPLVPLTLPVLSLDCII